MFESVIAARPTPFGKKWLAGPAAVAMHAVVVAALIAASAWEVGDIGGPSVPILFSAPSAPAPPPARGTADGEGNSRRVHPASAPIVAKLTVPTLRSIPAALPLLSPSAVEEAGPAAEGNGTGLRGDSRGVDDGTGDVPTEEGGSRLPISASAPRVIPPRLLAQAQPAYPEAAQRLRQQGLVVLQAIIGTDGAVENVQIVSSASPLFDEPAIRAVRQRRYVPATLDRRAVRVYLSVTMRFTLH